MKGKEKNVEFILNSTNQKIYDSIQDLLKKPKRYQKYMYYNECIDKRYFATMISENEEKISIVSSQYCLKVGNNGLYVKSLNLNAGITYYKKGRSNQRIYIWNTQNRLYWDLLLVLAEKLNLDNINLLKDTVVRTIATKGMLGSIFSDKIKTKTDVMSYYIRYSLRGIKINYSNADLLYDYLSKDNYMKILYLRLAKDPDDLLQNFDEKINNRMINCHHNLINNVLALDEKIDWVCNDFDAEKKRLFKKQKRTEDLLQIWQGGPKLKMQHTSYAINQPEESLPF